MTAVTQAEINKAAWWARFEVSHKCRHDAGNVEKMRAVADIVHRCLHHAKVRPSPQKMGLAFSEVYRLEIECIVSNARAEFDPSRHATLIDAIFRK